MQPVFLSEKMYYDPDFPNKNCLFWCALLAHKVCLLFFNHPVFEFWEHFHAVRNFCCPFVVSAWRDHEWCQALGCSRERLLLWIAGVSILLLKELFSDLPFECYVEQNVPKCGRRHFPTVDPRKDAFQPITIPAVSELQDHLSFRRRSWVLVWKDRCGHIS